MKQEDKELLKKDLSTRLPYDVKCKIALYNENCELLDTYYYEYNATHKNGQHEINFTDVKKYGTVTAYTGT